MNGSPFGRRTDELNSRLEHWIQQRTGGRIYCLRVESGAGRVILHGYTGSYYARQLALAAALEVLETSESKPREQVQLDIHVGTP